MSPEAIIRQFPLAGRATGLLIAGLATALAVTVAAPVSRSDFGSRYGVDTVYPLMLLPAVAVVALAGIAAALAPAVARAAAAVSGITAIHVLGMTVVASRDWRNYAGTGASSWQRGNEGSVVAVGMFLTALVVVLASVALYRAGNPHTDETPAVHRGWLVGGSAVAVVLPVVLGMHWQLRTLTAAGQFALWWSVPWGAGIIAAGATRVPVVRRAALATVLVSVAITCACVAVSPVFGFGLRLPGG